MAHSKNIEIFLQYNCRIVIFDRKVFIKLATLAGRRTEYSCRQGEIVWPLIHKNLNLLGRPLVYFMFFRIG